MLPVSFAPNLYEHFTLDSRATSRELGVQLAAADARLEGLGYLPEDAEREELAVAARILCEPSSRASYDQKVESGARLTWAQLEDYANTGRWDDSHHAPAPAHDAPRATPGTRVVLAVIDYVIAAIGVSLLVSFGVYNSAFNEVWLTSISGIITVAYYICFEVLVGATPAKLIAGYTVRDVTTREKLTWQQSIKRNWWRVASLVPLVGPLIAFFGALYVVTTIDPKNALRGQHDIMANAEVVKK
ncbi:RDD family protein [Corynebacterium guaraldiae]|uniref:RDD family protein n=1 Tax=Corynebacterium guaraldiae TaxID=3051103 RepID=UPI0011775E83|nr:RDD family protein [Corynebacterium guaraldiae]TRX43658.1 RDD family protein [Corynebacterium guaraldiae]